MRTRRTPSDHVTCSGVASRSPTSDVRTPASPCREESAIATLANQPTTRSGRRTSDYGAILGAELRPLERWTVTGLLLWLLVGPRIDLPGAHGLRVEDLVFVVLAVICVLHVGVMRRPTGPTLGILAVVGAGLVSVVVASARGMVDPVTSALFAVRPLEYWIVFPAVLLLTSGADERWSRRTNRVLVVVTVLQTAFAVMQYYFGLPIGFSHAAYLRAAGLTVGPYELGAISAALVAYWVAKGRFGLASLATIALAASISRVSLLGTAAALAFLTAAWIVTKARHVRRTGWRSAFSSPTRPVLGVASRVLPVVGAVLVLAFTFGVIQLPQNPSVATPGSAAAPRTDADDGAAPADGASEDAGESEPRQATPPDSMTQRLATTSVFGSWALGDRLAAAVPPVRTSADYADVAYTRLGDHVDLNTAAQSGAEASNLVRFFRWHLILDTVNDPADIAVGLGPSFVGPSVDGSYLRMFADGGLLGVAAWLVLIVLWLRRSPLWMTAVTISVLVGALFIDIVFSERPMVLFWTLLALAYVQRRNRVQDLAGAGSTPSNGTSTA